MFGGGGDSNFTFKILIMALVISTLLPMGMATLAPTAYQGTDPTEVLQGYEEFTGQKADTKVSVWPLTGIYLPFTGGEYDPESGRTLTYGTTEDGWLFGSEVKSYSPSQYQGTDQAYTVYKDDRGVFRYFSDSKDYDPDRGTGHKAGDLYTSVSFDRQYKSDIFFVESSRQEMDGFFYYDYSGYRMAFQPISNYTASNQDGQRVPVVATTTSLSLIWYQLPVQGGSGIAGQLVISGNSSGIAYLNAARILSAFNNNTNTSTFNLVFNGVSMNIIIKIDPMATSSGISVQEAYDMGMWSVMVTSLSVDANAYTGTDNSMNPIKVLRTMFDILTFNLNDYNVSPWIATLCGIIFVLPLYAGLITLCLDHAYLWILVGLLAAVQALAAFWPFRGEKNGKRQHQQSNDRDGPHRRSGIDHRAGHDSGHDRG